MLLESWKAPFSYRNGDQIPHGIAAKIDFERVDEKGTERERAKAEEKVPFIFRNEPERLRDLPQQLRAALGEIAQSSTVNQVSPATQRAFGLVKDTTSLPASDGSALFETDDPAYRYEQLKATLVAEGMQSVQTRIEDIGDDFLKFIRPWNATASSPKTTSAQAASSATAASASSRNGRMTRPSTSCSRRSRWRISSTTPGTWGRRGCRIRASRTSSARRSRCG